MLCASVSRARPRAPADDEAEDGLGVQAGPRDTLALWLGFITRLRARTHVILGSNSRYREEDKCLGKIFFDEKYARREKESQGVNFLQSGNLDDCVGCNKYKRVFC